MLSRRSSSAATRMATSSSSAMRGRAAGPGCARCCRRPRRSTARASASGWRCSPMAGSRARPTASASAMPAPRRRLAARSRCCATAARATRERPRPARIGYLLPPREQVMEGRPEAAPLLALAERAEELGYDSIWVGDSILARPRHEPLTLLSAVAARTRRAELGTAVLLPALRNPVVLAHGIATLDQISEGRFILGVGIASDLPNIRAQFPACRVPLEKRVGRMLEGLRLCRELWTGQPVTWNGRWIMENAVLGPVPYRPGGPPIWIGGMVRPSLERD